MYVSDTISSFIPFLVLEEMTSVEKISNILFGIKEKQLRYEFFLIVCLLLLEEWPRHKAL